MIDIKRGRNVDMVADWWLDEVKQFLTRPCKCYISIAPHRLFFNSYEEKLRFQCLDIVFKNYSNKKHKYVCLAQLNYWWQHIDEIILIKPDKMNDRVKMWNKKKIGQIKLLRTLSDVLTSYYSIVTNAIGGKLVGKLNIKTCPYCNRQFIYAFKGKSLERPELDHFFPKRLYPLYCLSFYNLIPVCHSCNHVKSDELIGVNPYRKPFKRKFVITDTNGHILTPPQIYKLEKNEIRLAFDGHDNEEESNEHILGLKDVYNKHDDYVKELIDKSLAYDKYAREALVTAYQSAGYHPRQVYDFVWGRHLMDAQYEDRPLSKLTNDILDLLQIKRG